MSVKAFSVRRLAACAVAAFLLASFWALPVFAAEASAAKTGIQSVGQPEEAEVGFYVRPRLPENQMSEATYFDLLMQPGTRQALEIEVHNRNSSDITVNLFANTASTNPNGIIDYKTPDIVDETHKVVFSEIASPRQESLLVPGGGSVVAIVDLVMPDEPFDGTVLGGVVIQKAVEGTSQPQAESEPQGTANIQNVINYIIAIKLTETDRALAPDFAWKGVELVDTGNRAAVIHTIHNPVAIACKDMELDIDILRENETTPVASVRQTGFDMAPNSVLAHPVSTDDGTLAPGQYTSHITLRYGGQEWAFTETFEIDGAAARTINYSAHPPGPAVFPWWGMVLLVVLVVLVLVLAALLIRKNRREKRKGQNRAIVYRARRK